MALKYLTKLFLLAAVLGLAFGGCPRPRGCCPRPHGGCPRPRGGWPRRNQTDVDRRPQNQTDVDRRPQNQTNVDICKDKIKTIFVNYTDGVGSSNVTIIFNANITANCTSCVSVTDGLDVPKITYNPPSANSDTNFTIILFDSDQIDELAPHLSWMVVNVQLQDISQGTLGNADTPAFFFPPDVVGDRYVFFIYRQRNYLDPQEIADLYEVDRFNFPVREFAKKYEFGDPEVGQYFTLNETCATLPILPELPKVSEVAKLPDMLLNK